jgi:hypothetical protein
MLGEQIAELKGKVTNQRVLDIEGPSIETSLYASGSINGVQVKVILTYVGKPTNTKGIFHGKGKAVVTAEGSEVATYTGEGIGRHDNSGKMSWRGSHFFSTSSTGKLAFLNNMIGVFESVIDSEGNFTEKSWEWK